MKALTSQKNLYLLGTQYYFRKSIPRNLVPYFGRMEYKKSLNSNNFRAACRKAWALNVQTEWFFEAVTTMAQKLTAEKIKELVQGHFELCLLEAEDAFFLEKNLAPADGFFDASVLRSMADRSHKRLDALQQQRQNHELSDNHKQTAQKILAQAVLECDTAHPDFYDLCNGIVRAQYEAERINHAYLSGNDQDGTIKDAYFTNCRNPFVSPQGPSVWQYQGLDYVPKSAATPDSITLGEALDSYFAFKRTELGQRDPKAQKQMEAKTLKLALFLPRGTRLNTLTHDQCWDLRDKTIRLPNNVHHLTDQEVAAAISSEGNYKRISPTTVGYYWQAFSSFFDYCRKRRWIAENPLEDIQLNLAKNAEKQRRNFTPSELVKLFQSPMFAGHRSTKTGRWIAGDLVTKDAQYWVPLIGLFQGMRLGEILGLTKADIKNENGIWYVHVRRNGRRRVKNFNSERTLPIHDVLVRLGLVDYLQRRIKALKADDDLVFEDGITIPQSQQIIKNYSRNFGVYLDQIGMTDRKLVFHSFRHNFCTAMASRADIPPHVMDALDGRSAGTDTRSNSRTGYLHFDLPTLKAAIDKVDLGIDLSYLYPA